MFKNRFWFIDTGKRRFGYEQSRVERDGVPYLDRYILYVGGPTLRLHKFWRGDDDRAPHDHPWSFWTFPFSDYWEHAYRVDGSWFWNRVRKFTWNHRPAEYRHIVIGPWVKHPPFGNFFLVAARPFWTFVVTTNWKRRWGFWPKKDDFRPWREWGASMNQASATQRPHE